jgi:TonB family protein
LIISAVVHILLALLIIFVTFRIKVPEPAEEGLLVNFGFDETGSGLYEPAPEPVSPPPPPATSGDEAGDEAMLTQDFEEAVEVKKAEPSPEELRRQAEARAAEQKRREEAEAEQRRIAQENAERQKREEEQRRIDQANARARNAFGNTGNTGTTGQSEGVAGGQGNQGVESGTEGVRNYGPGGGTGNSNISYNLSGRQHQSLPKPQYNVQDEGTVTVEVRVNRAGDVIMVRAGVPKTTVSDVRLIEEARQAALKTKFDSNPNAPETQVGTITYIFKLR